MGNAHLIDAELKSALDAYPDMHMSLETLPAIRAALAAMYAAASAGTNTDVTVEEKFIPGSASAAKLRILIYRPHAPSGLLPALFHIHGGGYMMGAPEMNAADHYEMAVALHCVIVSVDYRLAPETKHPGPVEDCYAALQWMHDHATELGVDHTRIGVIGESGGGGLAAAIALLARDRGKIPLIFQHLIYPMLDDRVCFETSPHPFTGGFPSKLEDIKLGWSCLLGDDFGTDNVSIYAAPSRAENLAGLPPAYIAVGALDLFLEENIEYARRLTRAGVPVELHLYPGAYHGFDKMVPTSRSAIAFKQHSYAALTAAMA